MEKLQELFNRIFSGDGEDNSPALLKIVFGGKRKKSLEYSRVTMRPVLVGEKLVYQAEYTYPKKVTHTNLEPSEACRLALSLVQENFKQVNIFLNGEEIQVLAAKPENPRITSKKSDAATVCMPALSHNKTKIILFLTVFHAIFSLNWVSWVRTERFFLGLTASSAR